MNQSAVSLTKSGGDETGRSLRARRIAFGHRKGWQKASKNGTGKNGTDFRSAGTAIDNSPPSPSRPPTPFESLSSQVQKIEGLDLLTAVDWGALKGKPRPSQPAPRTGAAGRVGPECTKASQMMRLFGASFGFGLRLGW